MFTIPFWWYDAWYVGQTFFLKRHTILGISVWTFHWSYLIFVAYFNAWKSRVWNVPESPWLKVKTGKTVESCFFWWFFDAEIRGEEVTSPMRWIIFCVICAYFSRNFVVDFLRLVYSLCVPFSQFQPHLLNKNTFIWFRVAVHRANQTKHTFVARGRAATHSGWSLVTRLANWKIPIFQ